MGHRLEHMCDSELNEQPRRNRGTQHLLFLNLSQQRIAWIILQIQIHISPGGPFPGGDEEGVTVDARVTQYPKETLSCILSRGKLDPDLGDMVKRLLRQNLGSDVPSHKSSMNHTPHTRKCNNEVGGLPRGNHVDPGAIIVGGPP